MSQATAVREQIRSYFVNENPERPVSKQYLSSSGLVKAEMEAAWAIFFFGINLSVHHNDEQFPISHPRLKKCGADTVATYYDAGRKKWVATSEITGLIEEAETREAALTTLRDRCVCTIREQSSRLPEDIKTQLERTMSDFTSDVSEMIESC